MVPVFKEAQPQKFRNFGNAIIFCALSEILREGWVRDKTTCFLSLAIVTQFPLVFSLSSVVISLLASHHRSTNIWGLCNHNILTWSSYRHHLHCKKKKNTILKLLNTSTTLTSISGQLLVTSAAKWVIGISLCDKIIFHGKNSPNCGGRIFPGRKFWNIAIKLVTRVCSKTCDFDATF